MRPKPLMPTRTATLAPPSFVFLLYFVRQFASLFGCCLSDSIRQCGCHSRRSMGQAIGARIGPFDTLWALRHVAARHRAGVEQYDVHLDAVLGQGFDVGGRVVSLGLRDLRAQVADVDLLGARRLEGGPDGRHDDGRQYAGVEASWPDDDLV